MGRGMGEGQIGRMSFSFASAETGLSFAMSSLPPRSGAESERDAKGFPPIYG